MTGMALDILSQLFGSIYLNQNQIYNISYSFIKHDNIILKVVKNLT